MMHSNTNHDETATHEQTAEYALFNAVIHASLTDENRRLRDECAQLYAHKQALARDVAALAIENAARTTSVEVPITGDQLRAWRRERGLSRAQAGLVLGISPRVIEHAEARGFMCVGRTVREALARHMKVKRSACAEWTPAPAQMPHPKAAHAETEMPEFPTRISADQGMSLLSALLQAVCFALAGGPVPPAASAAAPTPSPTQP
jgi:hypothetical protein